MSVRKKSLKDFCEETHNKQQCESLIFYKGTGYGEINNLLRTENISDEILKKGIESKDPVFGHIKNIDSSMRLNKEYQDIVLYRGIPGSIIPNVIKYNNGILVDKAYSSTTFNLDVAKKYIDEEGCCILIFILKKDSDVKSYKYPEKGELLNEDELLLERNLQFIIDIENSKPPVYTANVFKWEVPKLDKSSNKDVFETVFKSLTEDLSDSENIKRIVEAYDEETVKELELVPEDEIETIAKQLKISSFDMDKVLDALRDADKL